MFSKTSKREHNAVSWCFSITVNYKTFWAELHRNTNSYIILYTNLGFSQHLVKSLASKPHFSSPSLTQRQICETTMSAYIECTYTLYWVCERSFQSRVISIVSMVLLCTLSLLMLEKSQKCMGYNECTIELGDNKHVPQLLRFPLFQAKFLMKCFKT